MTTDAEQQLFSNSLSTIVSYPKLLEYEESLSRSPHSVTQWLQYLTDIDSYLEKVTDAAVSSTNANKNTGNNIVVIGAKHIPLYNNDKALQTELKALTRVRIDVAERALALLPGSYKLWKSHLDFRVSHPGEKKKKYYRSIVSTFERSLVRMHAMPRIWLMYLNFVQTRQHENLSDSNILTTIRRLYDRALINLPVTQHDKIWPEYLAWAKSSIPVSSQETTTDTAASKIQIPVETTLRILRRYALYYNPSAKEDLAKTCIALKRYGEGATLLVDILNDTSSCVFESTKHDLWMTFTDICTKHPDQILQISGRNVDIDFDKIIRAALGEQQGGTNRNHSYILLESNGEEEDEEKDDTSKHQQQTSNVRNFGEIEGILWCKLADYYIRLGEFEAARSIYEEAMDSVTRVRDFSLIFDAYSRFEEGTITAHLALLESEETVEDHPVIEPDNHGDEDSQDLELLLDTKGDLTSSNYAIELEMARAEHLMERRPLLLNRVLLKQNPHNVGEWLHRAELYANNKREAIAALEEGCKSVKSQYAVNGNPTALFLKIVSLYGDDIENVRSVFRKVCIDKSYRFQNSDDMAQIWAAWVEFELKMENYEEALSVIRQAITPPTSSDLSFRQQEKKQKAEGKPKGMSNNNKKGGGGGLHKSLRLWNLALDLEESLGGFSNAKACYARCVELGVATPQIILNYANFLSENKYFEESFAAYEKGISLFPFPHPSAHSIWSAYLTDFHNRYEGTKVERSRELYERCVEHIVPDKAAEIYLLYAKFEEKYGLAKRALAVYERLCTAVPKHEKLKAYELYIAKAESFSGPSKTRPIYEAAISALDDRDAAKMCLQYADLEARLGEIERARTSLTYGAQMADPRRDPDYWKEWHAFEVAHGNEETFREMLRVKRGVAAAFSTVNYNALEMGEPAGRQKTLTEEEALKMISEREGVKHTSLPSISGFVSGSKRTAAEANLEDLERQAARLRQATAAAIGKDSSSGNGPMDDGEIDIDSEEEDDEEEEEQEVDTNQKVRDVTTKSIPSAVFGGLLDAQSDGEEERSIPAPTATTMGALERLRAAASSNKQQ